MPSDKEYSNQCLRVFSKYTVDKRYKSDIGQIRKQMLPSALSDLSIEYSEKAISSMLSKGGKGTLLDFDSFCKIIHSIQSTQDQSAKSPSTEQRARNIDKAWSSLGGREDKSGKVSSPKMRLLLLALGAAFDVDQHLEALDANHKEKVNFFEFRGLFKEQ